MIENNEFQSIQADILILSPEFDDVILAEELVVALSFFNVPNIDTTSIQLFIDEVDYSAQIEIEDGIIAFVPKTIEPGTYKIQVRMKTTQGLEIEPIEWKFRIFKSGITVKSNADINGKISTNQSTEYVAGISKNVSEFNGKLSNEKNETMVYKFQRNSKKT